MSRLRWPDSTNSVSEKPGTIHFYELGGDVACPKHGRPEQLLAFVDFLARIKEIFDARNGQDFVFAKDAD